MAQIQVAFRGFRVVFILVPVNSALLKVLVSGGLLRKILNRAPGAGDWDTTKTALAETAI
jgi:hypothetical protein